jgi:hypothetical protein
MIFTLLSAYEAMSTLIHVCFPLQSVLGGAELTIDMFSADGLAIPSVLVHV